RAPRRTLPTWAHSPVCVWPSPRALAVTPRVCSPDSGPASAPRPRGPRAQAHQCSAPTRAPRQCEMRVLFNAALGSRKLTRRSCQPTSCVGALRASTSTWAGSALVEKRFQEPRASRDGGRRICMKGDPRIIELLNEVLTSELTAINQYFIHYRMLENWGYKRLGQVKRKESIEEMHHADEVISRILFLEGVPNMQRLSPVKVGETVVEIHQADLGLEQAAVERLNRAVAVATQVGDNGSRQLFEKILKEEEDAIDWLETHLGMIEQLGVTPYLAEMIGDVE